MNVPAKAEVKKMIKARTFPTIALTIFPLTMSAAAQKSKAVVPDYFPLRAGDSWTYRSASGDTEYSLKVLGEEKQTAGTIRYLVGKVAGAKVHTLFSRASGWVLMHSERYRNMRVGGKIRAGKTVSENPSHRRLAVGVERRGLHQKRAGRG
jgi:hypothetical protein